MKVFQIVILFIAVTATFASNDTFEDECIEIGQVEKIEVFEVGSNLVINWQHPPNIETCGFANVYYYVNYTSYQSVQNTITQDFHATFDHFPYPCVPNGISIYARSDTVGGAIATIEYYTEKSSVDNIILSETDNGLKVSWSRPENSDLCDFRYSVKYEDTLQGYVGESLETETYLPNIILYPCIESSITVVPINGEYVGVPKSKLFEGAITPVTNFALDSENGQVLALFDPPVNAQYCNLTYEVKEIETECFTKIVSVSAFDGKRSSEELSDVIEVEISAVTNLTAKVFGEVINLVWERPHSSPSCDITYMVTYNGTDFNTTTTSASVATQLLACLDSTIVVQPVSSTGKPGIPAEVHVGTDLSRVEELALTRDSNLLKATWEAPVDSEYCTLSYLLDYKNEAGSHIFVTEELSYNFQYTPCTSVSLTVTPHSDRGDEGISTVVTYSEPSCDV